MYELGGGGEEGPELVAVVGAAPERASASVRERCFLLRQREKYKATQRAQEARCLFFALSLAHTHTYARALLSSLFSRGLPVLIFTTTTSIMLLSSNSRLLLLASVLVIISGALASLGRTYTAHEIAKLELARSCILAARCLLGT